MLRRSFLPFVVWLIYRLWSATWRVTVVEHPSVSQARESGRPCIFAHWHGDELAILHFVKPLNIATMTSTSRDGRLMDRVIRRLGGHTCPGSSTHGGAQALRMLVRLCRRGHNGSMAVDGPRGPIYRIKPGIFLLAHLTNGVIVPTGIAASTAHVFRRSWNLARLPWPFARVVTYFGPAMEPPTGDTQSPDGEPAMALAAAIDKASEQARAELAG